MPGQTLEYGIDIHAQHTGQQAYQQATQGLHDIEQAADEAEQAVAGLQGGMKGLHGAGAGLGRILAGGGGIGDMVQLADQALRAQFAGMERRNQGIAEMLSAPFKLLPEIARSKAGDAARSFFDGLKEAIGGTQDVLMGGGIIKSLPLIGPLVEQTQNMMLKPLELVGGAIGTVADLFTSLVGGIVRGAIQIGQALWNFVVSAFQLVIEKARVFAEVALKVGAVAAAAFTGVVIAGVKAFADYEQAIRNAASVTGLMGEELATAEKQMASFGRELARTTSFMPTEVAEGLYAVSSAGLSVQQSMQAMPGIVALAQATLYDLGGTAELVTAAINTFSLSADQAGRIANVFGAAIGMSPLTMERLAASFPYAAAQANAFGMSIEETTAALMALAKAGITGSMAGTGLRGVLAELTVQSDQGKATLAKYGLQMKDIDPTVHGFAGAVERVARANMSAADMMEVFGRRSGPAMTILTKQGAAGLKELERQVTGTNYAFYMQQAQLQTTAGAWRLLKSTVQEALMGIGEGAGKWLANTMRTVNKALLGLADVGIYSKIGESIGAFIGALFGGIENIGSKIKEIGQAVAESFKPENMKKFGEAVREVAGRVWEAAQNMKKFGEAVREVTGRVWEAAQNVWKFATETLPVLWQWGVAVFSDLWRWMQEKIPAAIGTVGMGVLNLGLTFIDFGESVEGIFRNIAVGFGAVIASIGDTIIALGIVTLNYEMVKAGWKVSKAGTAVAGWGAEAKGDEQTPGWGTKYEKARGAFSRGVGAIFGPARAGAEALLAPNAPMNPEQSAAVRGSAWGEVKDAFRDLRAGSSVTPTGGQNLVPWGGSYIGPTPEDIALKKQQEEEVQNWLRATLGDPVAMALRNMMGTPAQQTAPLQIETSTPSNKPYYDRGRELADRMFEAAMRGMDDKLREVEAQKQRNTLRPSWQ